jgi:hypothetical protein
MLMHMSSEVSFFLGTGALMSSLLGVLGLDSIQSRFSLEPVPSRREPLPQSCVVLFKSFECLLGARV